jgi:hypothetical protein
VASVALLFTPVTTQINAAASGIGVVELDATISASHSFRVEATQHPVERGAKITDHLRPEPEVVTIEGLITNTPISRTQQTRAVAVTGGTLSTTAGEPSVFGVPGYAQEAFAKLLAIKDAGALVTLVTELKTYTDMAIVQLTVPRDATVGDALRFSATFQKIVIVDNKVTQIRPATDPRANKKVKRGRGVVTDIQHASKVVRKVVKPWTEPGFVGNRAQGIFDRFKFVLGGGNGAGA